MDENDTQGGELKGMARSIGNLFDSFDDAEPPPPASPVDSEPEPGLSVDAPPVAPVREEDGADDTGPTPDPRAVALNMAVSDFLLGSAADRPALADAVRSEFDVVKAANMLDVLVEAVNELLVQPVPDPVGEQLGKELMNATVESRMAIRLGGVRDERRRDDLIHAYASLGDSMTDAVAEALSATDDRLARRTYVALLVQMGDSGIRVVEQMVDDSRWFVARNGAMVLGELGGDAAIGMLTSTLANEDPRVRKETVLSLAKIGGEDAGVLAMGMLSDSDSEVRATAARAMAVLKVERALRPLLQRLDDEDDDVVVERVLRALGEIGDPSAVQAMEKKAVAGLLRKAPTDIRVAAYTGLAAIGTPHAMNLVEAALKDKDAEVRAAAQEALKG